MKKYAIICLLALLPACAGMNKGAVYTEKSLISGYNAWDEYVADVIGKCRMASLETVEARLDCMGKIPSQHDHVQKAVKSAVTILRMYWTAVSAGKDPKDLASILARLPAILETLPPEYFNGLMKIVDKLKKPTG